MAAFGRRPPCFEINRGQTDARGRYLARRQRYTLFRTPGETVLNLHEPPPRISYIGITTRPATPASVVRMRLIGANPAPAITGEGRLPGVINYCVGIEPQVWQTGIPTCARVCYQGVYPGIDLTCYGQRALEYDFLVAPGADPAAIALDFAGASRITIDAQGDLVLETPLGCVRQRRPVCYQEAGGVRKAVDCGYIPRGVRRVGFQVGGYDPARPLVIEPVLD